MIAIHDDLIAVLEAVELQSPLGYSLLGELRQVPSGGPADASEADTSDLLVSALARDLYERLYIRPTSPHRASPSDELARRDLVAALSAANNGSGTWQAGWTVVRIDTDGLVVVSKDDLEFWVLPADVCTPEGQVRPGQACRLRVAKERRHLVPGFYLALGDADNDDGNRAEPLDRYYWHLTPAAAVPFMTVATSLLNGSHVPFRIKVISDPSAFCRADAGVLYVRRSDHERIGPMIAELHSGVASDLRAPVPLFTHRLADGLGFAADPSSELSFGQHRCQLIAAALWQSFKRGEFDQESRLVALSSAFTQAGLDPRWPHLAPESRGVHFVVPGQLANSPDATTSFPRNRPRTISTRSRVSVAITPIEAAASIGLILCQSACWDRERLLCNWLGRSTAEVAKPGDPITPTATAIGPDLYSGSAGIALFLAQLHALTGEPQFRRAAQGAIARSINQIHRLPASAAVSPLSLFCGHLGVAYAARKVAALAGCPEIDAQVAAILDSATLASSGYHERDLIGGNAGAIAPLLVLGRFPGLERCRSLAIALGDELCETAVGFETATDWASAQLPSHGIGTGSMTGLSHGAAGIGLALLELHAATRRADFLQTARAAFEYADSLFDPEQGNWADGKPKEEPAGVITRSTFSMAWCHGAPGIALSRLRAAALDPDLRDKHLAMGRIAIASTLRAIESNLQEPRSDTSLCHGLSGLGEVILIASQLLSELSCHHQANALGQALIDRYGSTGDWPSGVPSGGPNPSLMLGLAGIGYWLLRLHDPASVVPFLLLMP
jgi:hypothetical protein